MPLLGALAPRAPSPELTWVAKVKFIVRATVVASVPEGSVGFVVVADKNSEEDGGGALEEEAQHGELQSPARGAARGPCHGTEATSLHLWLRLWARGTNGLSRAGGTGFTGPRPRPPRSPPTWRPLP